MVLFRTIVALVRHLLRIMSIFVPFQTAVRSVRISADIAYERCLLRNLVVRIVSPLLVPLHSLLVSEHRLTAGESTRNPDLVVGVLLDVMCFVITRRYETLTADFAQQWLQACVNAQMGVKSMLKEEL